MRTRRSSHHPVVRRIGHERHAVVTRRRRRRPRWHTICIVGSVILERRGVKNIILASKEQTTYGRVKTRLRAQGAYSGLHSRVRPPQVNVVRVRSETYRSRRDRRAPLESFRLRAGLNRIVVDTGRARRPRREGWLRMGYKVPGHGMAGKDG